MGFFDFLKSQPVVVKKSSAPKAKPLGAKASAPLSRPVSSLGPLPSASELLDEIRHITSYTDVPNFQSLMTDGESAVFKLSLQQRDQLVVLEMTGRKAQMIISTDKPPQAALVESVRGVCMASNYKMLPLMSAPAVLINELYGAKVGGLTTGQSRSTSVHMAMITELIQYALENDATDIHMETRGSKGVIRFRIHGEVENKRDDQNRVIGNYAASAVVDCMGTLYNLMAQKKSSGGAQFEKEKNQYCMIPFTEIPDHSLKLRFQSVKGNEGPKAVMRLLHINENQKTLSFETLGYETSHCEMLSVAMDTPSGAVLIAGITNSGKTTTLKSFIELNPAAPTSAIFTIEDPVEYPIRYAHQIPIQRDLSNPAESARMYNETVSALMRLDPDIAVLQEIRDRFSAMALQQLIESGHMGLGTVHAHLLSGIVPRLVNPEIGMNREVLTSPNMLTLLVYQALVPKLCPNCSHTSSQAAALDPNVNNILKNIYRLELDESIFRWKNTMGCSQCRRRGTVGQTVVAEMMMPDNDWLRLIRDSKDTEAAAHYRSSSDRNLLSGNMDGKTVFEHTLFKASQGTVDVRQCSRFDVWSRYMKSAEKNGMAKAAA